LKILPSFTFHASLPRAAKLEHHSRIDSQIEVCISKDNKGAFLRSSMITSFIVSAAAVAARKFHGVMMPQTLTDSQ
jgi:hypothetical protein